MEPGLTVLLHQWQKGNEEAGAKFASHVYAELRQLARGLLARERSSAVSPSTLVHEVYLRLFGDGPIQLESRRHFFGVVLRAMRQFLVEEARRRQASKRGGGIEPLTLSGLDSWGVEPTPDLLDLDRGLERLALVDARKARVLELRYLAGCSVPEIGALLQLSPATVKRDLLFATAWLRRELGGDPVADLPV
ncbi:MAG: ECF-type sigma factor [Thermoanaerobaculia bacterium]|nr:ECF-type sigma factor [Thermoanaerobaculia bacterium]